MKPQEKKPIEKLFELSNYDSKNITNKGEKTISQETLTEIETKGVTLEQLETLGVPVFKYRTQITIHGLFPTLHYNYLTGYKSIFQNKNLSIGVKWDAVDYSKKKRIYEKVQLFDNGWYIRKNSSEYMLVRNSKHFDTKEQYLELLPKFKAYIENIDKSLFFGNAGISLVPAMGTYFLFAYINIGAIKETNVEKLIESICQKPLNEIEASIEADRKERERQAIENRNQWERERQERQAAEKPLHDKAKQMLTDAGYVFVEKNIECDDIVLTYDIYENNIRFGAKKYTIKKGQKQFRYDRQYNIDLLQPLEFTKSSLFLEKTIQTKVKGWVKPKQVIEPQIVEAKKETVLKAEISGVYVCQYSDKALAIFGETKAIKDTLKAIGARFNPYLNNNGKKEAGWILPLTAKEKLTAAGLTI